ncbi:MAG: hypothetical protein OHK0046_12340 [Anaerolineae bacterium]
MFENWSNSQRFVAAFLGLLLVAGLIENAPVLLVLLILFAVLYNSSNRQQDDERGEVVEQVRRAEPVRRERAVSAEQIHQHALRAVRRAGLDPNALSVLPVNIGLLMYYEDNPPVIYANRPVEDDSDYIQPFVELRVPVNATGRIRFEIVNGRGETVFRQEDSYYLERGRNLITPATRLPVHEELGLDGRWELRVTADNVVIARHIFSWEAVEDSSEPAVNRHIGEDGEISSELRAALAENRLQRLSLDELLAYQDDPEPPQDDLPRQQRNRQ